MSVRPIDAWKENWPASTEVRRGARRVPRSHARGKKNVRRRRIDARGEKGGKKKIFRRERKKYYSGGSEKKILFGRERKKILTSTRTQPTKRLLRTVEMSFFDLFLSGVDIIYWKELQPLGFFLKVNAEDKKYSLKMNAKRKKYMMTDKSQSDKKNSGGFGGYPPEKM